MVKIQAREGNDNGGGSYLGCFYNCTSLKKVIFEDGNTPITFYNEITKTEQTNSNDIFYGCPIEELYIGREFANSSYTFKKLDSLKNLKIGSCVKSLEHISLGGSGITKIVVPDNVTNIASAFAHCTSLLELYIGNGVTDFNSPIYDCEKLKHLYIGNSLESFYLNSEKTKIEDIVITSSKIRKWKILYGGNGVKIYLPQKDMYSNAITEGEKLSIAELIGTTQEYSGETPKFNLSTKLENAEFSFDNANIPHNAGSYKENVPIGIKIGEWKSSFDTEVSYTITKAPLTVIANNIELPYGSEKKGFTVSYFGFKNGEDESVLTKPVSVSTTAETDSPVGTYPIIPFGGYADNYNLSYERGVLTVVKAEQTIDWNTELPDEATVGTKIKLEATASSGLPVSFKSSDNGIASITVIGGEYYLNCKSAGNVEISACQAGNKNYESATDEARSMTITASTGIADVETGATGSEKIYDISGNVLKRCQRGVNIVRRSDGTTKKIVIK